MFNKANARSTRVGSTGASPWGQAACTAALLLTGLTGAAVPLMAAVGQQAAAARQSSQVPAEFKKRVDEYGALHKKLEATLPKLSKEATPEEIDRNQRALVALISAARAQARPGDLFTPPTQAAIRSVLRRLFTGVDRRRLRESIQDENPGPGNVRLTANGRYPDAVPLASMPAELLQALPPLPEELEYRFVGDTLILLDPHSHLVVDLMPNALPK
jgi:hypothetical protein